MKADIVKDQINELATDFGLFPNGCIDDYTNDKIVEIVVDLANVEIDILKAKLQKCKEEREKVGDIYQQFESHLAHGEAQYDPRALEILADFKELLTQTKDK